MRQSTYHSAKNRLLTFLFLIVALLSSNQVAVGQSPTVLIERAIAIKKDSLLLDLKIKRFKSQDLILELKHMVSGFTQKINLAASLMSDVGNTCFIRLRLKFPPGDIQILLFDQRNSPICNQRRQNTEENAKNYDPSKGNK